MPPSKFLLFLILSFIVGIFIGSLIKIPAFFIGEFLFLSCFWFVLSLFFRKNNSLFALYLLLFALCLFIFSLTVLRTNTYNKQINLPAPAFLNNLSIALQTANQKILPYQQATFLNGFLFGNTKPLSAQFKENLNKAGIRHITAVSGMHIVILASLISSLLLTLGISRNSAFYFSFALLWLFVLLVGAPPSALRAGVMTSFLLFSQKIGRQNYSLNGLLLAFCLMLAFNPLLLRESVGFQLSFTASFGIIMLNVPINNFLRKIKTPAWLSSLLSVSLSAQVFTFGLLIYHFGYISLVSPLTNILSTPALPFLMGFGLLFSLSALILPVFAYILLFPVWLLASYIIYITNFFASLPFSQTSLRLHWFYLFIIYGLLFLAIWQIKKRQQKSLF